MCIRWVCFLLMSNHISTVVQFLQNSPYQCHFSFFSTQQYRKIRWLSCCFSLSSTVLCCLFQLNAYQKLIRQPSNMTTVCMQPTTMSCTRSPELPKPVGCSIHHYSTSVQIWPTALKGPCQFLVCSGCWLCDAKPQQKYFIFTCYALKLNNAK